MPYAKIETKFSGPGEELTSEPCYKKLKSTAEDCVFPHHGSADFHKIQQKAGNNWVPVAIIDVRGHGYPEEDKTQTTDLVKPVHDKRPGSKLDVIESTDSQGLQGGNPPLLSTDDEIYSTSKEFIGPIYKPPEKKKLKERRNQTNTVSGINGSGVREEKQNSKKPEIDTELSQFYKEIEELENEKDDSEEGGCKELESSQEQVNPYCQRYSTDILKSDDIKELCTTFQAQCDYQQYLENELGHYYDEQEIPTFCDISFTSFRPEWQSMHPFLVPHGPPLPSFNYHLNIPSFSTSPNLPPNIFTAQDNSLMRNGYYENSFHDNWDCLTFDQNNEYTVIENSGNAHPSRNGYSLQDGYVTHDFCEIRQGFWKDPIDKYNETHRFVNQQFQEEKLNKLQKLLILLRGLPGSGKTTLSKILLGQSRDGIVFSTDDYFHHQDGYRYNVNQLGDAHDWNQKRARQAIDQGRSPIIIDNTNTQAWEMKPYVEMAIGKGYRVEFHEPETWWKFDPEELEKRNKHGVSRQKIAQMLDRYEYQMSISIVMNSVEPQQKSTQRLTPPQGSQREGLLRKTEFQLSKAKQKRNRKRNKKFHNLHEITDENSLETLSYLTTGAQHASQNEDFEGTKTISGCLFTGSQNKVGDFLNGGKENNWKSIHLEDSFQNVVSTVELDNTPKNCFPERNDDWILDSSSVSNKSSGTCPTGTQNLRSVTMDDCPVMKVEKNKGNKFRRALNRKNSFARTPCSFLQKTEVDQRLPNELIQHSQHGSRASENILREEQEEHASKNNYWAFFTHDLSDEDLQQGSERQPYFGSWPEGPYKFVCEQRPKKDRSHKLAFPDNKEQLIKLISTSEGTSEPGNRPKILINEKLLVENEDLSPITETIDPFQDTETINFRSCLSQLDNPKSALESTMNQKRRQRKILSLVPNFNLLGESLTNMNKHILLIESHVLNNILGEDKISEINEKQKLMSCNNHKTLSFHFDIIKDSPLNIGGQFYFPCQSFNRLGHAMYLYKNPVTSLVLCYISSFWMIYFTNKKTFLAFQSQTRVGNILTDTDFTFSDILCSQPDTLYSLRITSDTQFLNESSGEKLKKVEDSESLHCLSTEDHYDLTSMDFNSYRLPISQRFAFQLVKLFGPPGIPVGKLFSFTKI